MKSPVYYKVILARTRLLEPSQNLEDQYHDDKPRTTNTVETTPKLSSCFVHNSVTDILYWQGASLFPYDNSFLPWIPLTPLLVRVWS